MTAYLCHFGQNFPEKLDRKEKNWRKNFGQKVSYIVDLSKMSSGSVNLTKTSLVQMSLAKKVDPREAAARKAAEEATKRALDKKRKEEESKKEK